MKNPLHRVGMLVVSSDSVAEMDFKNSSCPLRSRSSPRVSTTTIRPRGAFRP